MSTILKDTPNSILITDKIKKTKIGIIVAEWNKDITGALLKGAEQALQSAGIETVIVKWVPGSFELPLGAQYLIEHGKVSAVICIGCVIKGDTPHFHYISDAVTNSISHLAIKYMLPVVFGVLTVDTLEQAQERAGGKLGNKGEEAAIVAMQMLSLKEEIINDKEKKSIGF